LLYFIAALVSCLIKNKYCNNLTGFSQHALDFILLHMQSHLKEKLDMEEQLIADSCVDSTVKTGTVD